MNLSRLTVAASLAFAAATPTFATTLSGVVTGTGGSGGFVGQLSGIQVLSGTASLPSFATIICVDAFDHWPADGSTQHYTLYSDLGSIVSNAAAGARATDFANYVVDKYYDSAVVHGDWSTYTGYQFNQAMWELVSDFNGTAGSLSTAAGHIVAGSIGTSVFPAIVDDLKTNFSTIAQGYRSSQYTVSFLGANDAGYQSMMMLSPIPTAPVPEPNTLALLSAGGLAMGFVVRRRKAR